MATTYTEISKTLAKHIATMDGAVKSYRKFGASNGVNYVDVALDLPDGSHLELVCINPTGSCRYVWNLYSAAGTIAAEYRPMARGFFTGRHSDYMAHILTQYERCKKADRDAAKLFVDAYCGGEVPTQAAIEAQRERGRIARGG